jgi:hypothetical protein
MTQRGMFEKLSWTLISWINYGIKIKTGPGVCSERVIKSIFFKKSHDFQRKLDDFVYVHMKFRIFYLNNQYSEMLIQTKKKQSLLKKRVKRAKRAMNSRPMK